MRFNLWRILGEEETVYRSYLWLLRKYVRVRYRKLSKQNAIRVMDQEWDYLIILDACRYDLFRKVVNERAGFFISGGSDTQEWLEWNFNGEFKDVVYIAGNPHLAIANLLKTFSFNPFYKVIGVWDFGWNSTFKTVPPEEVTLAALEALKKYPDKRMIIHYNQPHHPFLSDSYLLRLDDGTWSKPEEGVCRRGKMTIWDAVRLGKVPIDRVWKGYKENLKLVMDEVKRLVDDLHGKVIITSDHGNHIGEYMLFGHIKGMTTKELVKIPWLVVKDEERKTISGRKAERGGDQMKLETEDFSPEEERMIRERLRELGYMD